MKIEHCYYVNRIERDEIICIFFVSNVDKKYITMVTDQVGREPKVYDFEVRAHYHIKKGKLTCSFVYVIDENACIPFEYKFKREQKDAIKNAILKEIK